MLEESALGLLASVIPQPDSAASVKLLQATQEYYASYRTTTLQDGAASPQNVKLLTEAAKQGQLYLDVIAYMYQQFHDVSANPLTVEPAKIKDIEVLETIKEGRSVYRRK